MSRFGLLAALLICGTPGNAAPHMLVSLDRQVDTARPLNAPPDPHLAPPFPGMHVTWESLLNRGSDAPMQDICAAFGRAVNPDGAGLPFDPAQVLSKLVDQGLCGGKAG